MTPYEIREAKSFAFMMGVATPLVFMFVLTILFELFGPQADPQPQACADHHDARAMGWTPAPGEMAAFREMDANCQEQRH